MHPLSLTRLVDGSWARLAQPGTAGAPALCTAATTTRCGRR